MTPIPVLGIPFLNRTDLLRRCVDSIDYPVDKLVIIQNGSERFDYDSKPNPLIKQMVYITHPNAGVSGSWNEIIKLFPAPWWMIVNNDIQFTPGDLERLAKATVEKAGSPAKFYGNHGASYFTITAECVDVVGLFDENFIAYLEDCDYARRCDLVGVSRITVSGCNAIHGEVIGGVQEGSRTINSDPILASENSRTHKLGFQYYIAKHGGVNDREKFARLFNNPNWPVWAWRFDTKRRKENQWNPPK